jgi:hypothetical protein
MLFDISIVETLICGIEGACQELDRLGVRWGDLDKVRGQSPSVGLRGLLIPSFYGEDGILTP